MTTIIDNATIPKKVANKVGLCYFDPETEQLVEFNQNEQIFLTPFETSIKRYYLVKTAEFINNTRPTLASITITSASEELDLKITVGLSSLTSKEYFDEIEINNTTIVFFNEYTNGIIPLDIYFRSLTNRSMDASFDLNISVE